MPANATPQSPEALGEQMFHDEFETVLAALAAEQGPPPDSARVTEPRKVALWGLQDPRVDGLTFAQQLQSQGFGPDDLKQMQIVQNHPELAQVYGQPQADPNVVADLTKLAQYPFRLGLYHDIPDPVERTAEAERIHRAWLKQHGWSQDTPAAVPVGLPLPLASTALASAPAGGAEPPAGAPAAPPDPAQGMPAAVPPALPQPGG